MEAGQCQTMKKKADQARVFVFNCHASSSSFFHALADSTSLGRAVKVPRSLGKRMCLGHERVVGMMIRSQALCWIGRMAETRPKRDRKRQFTILLCGKIFTCLGMQKLGHVGQCVRNAKTKLQRKSTLRDYASAGGCYQATLLSLIDSRIQDHPLMIMNCHRNRTDRKRTSESLCQPTYQQYGYLQ